MQSLRDCPRQLTMSHVTFMTLRCIHCHTRTTAFRTRDAVSTVHSVFTIAFASRCRITHTSLFLLALKMRPATLCLSAFCTGLLSFGETHAAPSFMDQPIVIDDTPITQWRSLSIVVTLTDSHPPYNQYPLYASPVLSFGQKEVLYNVNASFDSINDPSAQYTSVSSYVLMEGRAVIDPNPQKRPLCLESETGPYVIPPINGIVRALMDVTVSTPLDASPCARNLSPFTVDGQSYVVCETEQYQTLTITGNGMVLTVSFVDNVEVKLDAGQVAGCQQVAFPTPVTPMGMTLLTGVPLSYQS